jgi:hypothetical protein
LIVRTGFTEALGGMTAEEQGRVMAGGAHGDDTSTDPMGTVGIESSVRSARWFWDKHFAAVAGDTIAFEAVAPQFDAATGSLHVDLSTYTHTLYPIAFGGVANQSCSAARVFPGHVRHADWRAVGPPGAVQGLRGEEKMDVLTDFGATERSWACRIPAKCTRDILSTQYCTSI